MLNALSTNCLAFFEAFEEKSSQIVYNNFDPFLLFSTNLYLKKKLTMLPGNTRQLHHDREELALAFPYPTKHSDTSLCINPYISGR